MSAPVENSVKDPLGEEAELDLAAAVLRRTAPAEAALLPILWPHYRNRKSRYRVRPSRLTAQGGGRLGGTGWLAEAALVAPYVMAASTVALEIVRSVAEEQISSAVTSWIHRRPKARPATVTLTYAQLLSVEAAVDRVTRTWDLTEEQRSLLVVELRTALIARFAVGEDQVGEDRVGEDRVGEDRDAAH